MPKIILNDKRMFGREKPFKIQINREKKGLNLERKQELEVNNGECELRIFESFFMVKSPKVKLEVSDKKLELDLNYNYILLSIIGLLHVLVVLLVYLLNFSNYLFFMIMFALSIDVIILILFGIYTIKVKGNDDLD